MHSTVLIIDDHPVVIAGVRQLLAGSSEFTLIGECSSAEQGLEAARRERPDLIVLGLRLADVLAPDLCRALRSVAPGAKVVIFTAFDEEALLRACLEAGAVGILLKDAGG